MRNKTFWAIVLAMVIMLGSCGKQKRKPLELQVQTDSIVVDTIVHLNGSDAPRLTLHLNYKYVKSGNKKALNEAILRSGILVPDYYSLEDDTLDVTAAIKLFTEKYIADYLRDARLIFEQEKDNPEQLNWQYKVDTEILQGSEEHITYIAHVRSYEGGEVMPTYTIAKNFNMKTGKLITLADVFKRNEMEELTEDIVDELCDITKCRDLEDLQKNGVFKDIAPYPTENFSLTDEDITFHYIPGEINLMEKGTYDVTVNR